jgi:hypothetical protein
VTGFRQIYPVKIFTFSFLRSLSDALARTSCKNTSIKSSALWDKSHEFRWKSTDVSVKHFSSIFRYNYKRNKKPAWPCSLNFFILVSCLAYSFTLNMEATCSSETWVDFQLTTRRYISEDRLLPSHPCFKSYIY